MLPLLQLADRSFDRETLFNNNINMINNRNNKIQSSYDNNTTDDGTSEQEKDNDISELEQKYTTENTIFRISMQNKLDIRYGAI